MYGEVPPDAAPVNIVVCPVVGFTGLTVKLLITGVLVSLHDDTGWSSHPV